MSALRCACVFVFPAALEGITSLRPLRPSPFTHTRRRTYTHTTAVRCEKVCFQLYCYFSYLERYRLFHFLTWMKQFNLSPKNVDKRMCEPRAKLTFAAVIKDKSHAGKRWFPIGELIPALFCDSKRASLLWKSGGFAMSSRRNSVRLKLRRSFSEQLRSSTSKAWDLLWRNVRERRLAGQSSTEGTSIALKAGSTFVYDIN